MGKHSCNFQDLTNQKFNRLLVIKEAGKSSGGSVKWECLCDCGNLTIVTAGNLKNDCVKSCGCLAKEKMSKMAYRHGLSGHPLYHIYGKMLKKCYDENVEDYKNYGARGIIVEEPWKSALESFINWGMENGYEKGLTLERMDNNGPYAPWNCRWATWREQQNNKRSNVFIEVNGERLTQAQAGRKYNINPKLISKRLKRGWTDDDAVFLPKGTKKFQIASRQEDKELRKRVMEIEQFSNKELIEECLKRRLTTCLP